MSLARPLRLSTLALWPLLLAGCGYDASKLSHEAQISMIGMSQNDLESCAGPPDKTTVLSPGTDVFTYEYKPGAGDGFNLQLPLDLGGVSLGGSGTYCRADLRLVDRRVAELHYTGDDDRAIGSDGVCAPLIRGCMRQPEPTMADARAARTGAGAFASPPVPALPPAAESGPTTK